VDALDRSDITRDGTLCEPSFPFDGVAG